MDNLEARRILDQNNVMIDLGDHRPPEAIALALGLISLGEGDNQ